MRSLSSALRRAVALTICTIGLGAAVAPAIGRAAAQFGIGGNLDTTTYGAIDSFAKCRVNRYPCPVGELSGWGVPGSFANGSFATLKSALPLRQVRFVVPYDALSQFQGNSCTTSSTYFATGGAAWNDLLNELAQAKADGLTPEVALAGGGGGFGVPGAPIPVYGTAGDRVHALTLAGQDYRCGVEALMNDTAAQDLPVAEWEAWNEPDTNVNYNGPLPNACTSADSPCAGTYNDGGYVCGSLDNRCGALEAAALWNIAERVATADAGLPGFPKTIQVAAGAFGAGPVNRKITTSWNYVNEYMTEVDRYFAPPKVVSLHPNNDISASGRLGTPTTTDTQAVIAYLNSVLSAPPKIWITEASGNLADPATTYAGEPATCTSAAPGNDGPNLGACLNGNGAAQAAGARGFLALGALPQVTRVFWYQFLLQSYSDSAFGLPDFDSALLDASGTPRPSYCVLVSRALTHCRGNVTNYQH
jgi:hypothetical protein